MKKMFYISLFIGVVLGTQSASAKTYEVPPSSSTSTHVPYISDQAMEACVKLYNEGEWLGDEIRSTQVDSYSRTSVDAYNNKVNRHSNMINAFNRDCAGKQSESAYKAAQKLNSKS